MYMLQLFDSDDAIEPIDARLLADGTLEIGRDPGADWVIPDPDCALSRTHCELHASPEGLSLRSLGGNGVFDAVAGTRYPDGVTAAVPLPSALRMGRFRLVATLAPRSPDGFDVAGTMIFTPPLGGSIDVPSDWNDGHETTQRPTGSLMDAFCVGAGLDSSLLSGDDPQEVMRRAGALYRQMVLGIGDLMAERDRARARFQLTRTTIGGSGNNPFKWAPSQRLAIDLLLSGSHGFLTGPAALQASFRDVKRHLVASFAGLQGSLREAIDSFDPKVLDTAAEDRPGFLKGKASRQAEEVARRHADLADQIAQGRSGSLDQAFVRAYDEADAALNTGDVD